MTTTQTFTIPCGELWEIEAPCAVELHIGGNHMGNLSQKAGTLKVRGTKGATIIKSREPIVYVVAETEEQYTERKAPSNRSRDHR